VTENIPSGAAAIEWLDQWVTTIGRARAIRIDEHQHAAVDESQRSNSGDRVALGTVAPDP
jgi:hypothetical protein